MSSSRNAAAAEMQSLMARLQGRLAGGNAQRERFTTLANQIRSGDESDKYTALTEVCEALNMATEEILMGMRPDVLVPPPCSAYVLSTTTSSCTSRPASSHTWPTRSRPPHR
jgi:hypothetical protein